MGARIIRNGPSPCKRCSCQYSTLKHVFDECPRAQAIWAAVNEGWEKRFNAPLVFDFRGALNPGADKEFSTKVYDSIGAITVQQIWLDYCAKTHDNPLSSSSVVLILSLRRRRGSSTSSLSRMPGE